MSRAAFLGAVYGGMHGTAAAEADSSSELGVPLPWVSLLHDGACILEAARKLVDLRKSLAGQASMSEDIMMGA